MTCKTVNEEVTTTKDKKTGTKSGSKMKRRVRGRVYKNDIYDRNCSRHEIVKHSSNIESTQLVETEFKILQSLIPGISNQPDISEVSLFDFVASLKRIKMRENSYHIIEIIGYLISYFSWR